MFRRLILFTLTVLLTVPVFARGAESRKKYREYKREGWELYGSSRTLKNALKEHCDTMAVLDLRPIRKSFITFRCGI